MKQIVHRLPEAFFLGVGIYWLTENFLALSQINWLAIVFVALLVFQLIYQNRIVGITLGLVLGLICAYMMFAVLSEFYEFKSISSEALELLGVGLGLFGLGVLAAAIMLHKFVLLYQNDMRAAGRLTA